MSSSGSDFETNSFEKGESDEFCNENELSDSLRERFSNILLYQFALKKEENAEETLCSLLRLKSRSAREAFRHLAFMGNCLTISHTYKPYLPSR